MPDGTLRSDELELILRPEEKLLRLVDPVSGKVVPTLAEAAERAEEVEAELARVRAELDALRPRRM